MFRMAALLITTGACSFGQVDPATIYRQVRESVVLVSGDHKQGSGFVTIASSCSVIATNCVPGGLIVTNYHVVAGETSVKLTFENGREVTVDNVIAFDPELDLALISFKDINAPAVIADYTGKPGVGEKVFAIGNPLGLEGSLSDGLVSGFRQIGDREMIQFSAPISPGSSGGPLLNKDGLVIGIVTASIRGGQNLNFAVPISLLRGMVRKAYFDPDGNQTRSLQRTPLASLAPQTNENLLAPPIPSKLVAKSSELPTWWFSARPETVLADPGFEDLSISDRDNIMAQIDPHFARMSYRDRHGYLWRAETKYLPRGNAASVVTWVPSMASSTSDVSLLGIRKSLTAGNVVVSARLERIRFFEAHVWIVNSTNAPIGIDPRTWVLNVLKPKKYTLYFEYPSRVSWEVGMGVLNNILSLPASTMRTALDDANSIPATALARLEVQPGQSVDGDVYFEIDSKAKEVVLRIFIAERAYDIPFVVSH
jgi:hypothetical protein